MDTVYLVFYNNEATVEVVKVCKTRLAALKFVEVQESPVCYFIEKHKVED